MSSLKSYLTLFRATISIFAAASAATGYFLAPHRQITGVFPVAGAVFLLACGASALNQYQERYIDARMERTRTRPLPSGSITASHALSLSCALVLAGLASLAYACGTKAALLGLFALLWYNGIYTHLKKRTAFAAVPGAVVGMVPPAIGWVSAGGALLDPRLAAICFLFFLWQVPHFWLLLLIHGEEYEQAGLPSLTGVMSRAADRKGDLYLDRCRGDREPRTSLLWNSAITGVLFFADSLRGLAYLERKGTSTSGERTGDISFSRPFQEDKYLPVVHHVTAVSGKHSFIAHDRETHDHRGTTQTAPDRVFANDRGIYCCDLPRLYGCLLQAEARHIPGKRHPVPASARHQRAAARSGKAARRTL